MNRPGNDARGGREAESLAADQLGGSRLGRLPETGQLFRRPLPPAATRRVRTWAIVAVARTLLVAIYHMLKDGTQYKDLGPKHFDRIDGEAIVRGRVSRMERLGYRGHR
jgi:hypothetical protein